MRRLGDFTTTPRVLPITLLAAATGTLSAFLALTLLKMIAFFTNVLVFQRFTTEATSPAQHHLGFAIVLVPILGGLVIGLMARYGSDKIRGHGIPEAIEAILVRGSRVDPKVALLKPLSSAISIGSGGPFGAEGPIIMTGGAFGSLVAQCFSLTSAERKTLLVAGAAGGMSAVFASPLAATLLAVELLLFEWKPRSFLPVVVASAVAASLRPWLLGDGPVFPVVPHDVHPNVPLLLACVACGLAGGALSTVLSKAIYVVEDVFQKVPLHWMWWPAIGGAVIGLGGLVEPRALGVGYDVIESLLAHDLALKALLVLMAVKAVIWAISLGSGTSGGVLAPLLILGASLGGLESHVFPSLGTGFWPLVSMAAVLGGTMRSPLMAIVFALEITHDWAMALPLLVAVPVAYLFTVLVLKRSILTEKISRRGLHLSAEYATDPLEILFVREVMKVSPSDEHPPDAVAHAGEPLRVAVGRMARLGTTELPVVDEGRIVGLFTLADALKARVRHLEEEQRRERVFPRRRQRQPT